MNWNISKFDKSFVPKVPEGFEIKNASDGYHTFAELYEFRLVYNVALFNEWAGLGKFNVHKSYKHFDGELCFGSVVDCCVCGKVSHLA